jgi:hypothetical protein
MQNEMHEGDRRAGHRPGVTNLIFNFDGTAVLW